MVLFFSSQEVIYIGKCLDEGTEVRGSVHCISYFAPDHGCYPDPEAAGEHEHERVVVQHKSHERGCMLVPVQLVEATGNVCFEDPHVGPLQAILLPVSVPFTDNLLEGGESDLLVSFDAAKSCVLGIEWDCARWGIRTIEEGAAGYLAGFRAPVVFVGAVDVLEFFRC